MRQQQGSEGEGGTEQSENLTAAGRQEREGERTHEREERDKSLHSLMQCSHSHYKLLAFTISELLKCD